MRRLIIPAALIALAVSPGAAWALAPTSVFNGVAGGATSPETVTASGSCSAGQVATASVQLPAGNGSTVFTLQDSTDNAPSSWSATASQVASSFRFKSFKRTLSSSFVASTTTFTVTFSGSSSPAPTILISCFTDGTGTTNAANDSSVTGGAGTATSFTQTVTGPVSGTSYQWATAALGNNISTIALGGGTTGGWTLDQKSSGTGVGLAAYYRAAGGSTASTTLNATFTSTNWALSWQEVMTGGAATIGSRMALTGAGH